MSECPICGEGVLFYVKDTQNITYKGIKGFVNFYYSKCNACESKIAGDWQLSVNRDNVLYFHKMVDGGWIR